MSASDHLNAEQLQLFVVPQDRDYRNKIYANVNAQGFPSPKHWLLAAAEQSDKAFVEWAKRYDEAHELKLF